MTNSTTGKVAQDRGDTAVLDEAINISGDEDTGWVSFVITEERDLDKLVNPYGSPGRYEVVLTAYKPGDGLASAKGSVSPANVEMGDSFLQINPVGTARSMLTLTAKADGRRCDIRLIPNESGRLSCVQLGVEASSFKQAKETALRWASPLLNDLSFRSDAAIDIKQIDVRELQTNSYEITVLILGKPRVMILPEGGGWLVPEIKAAVSYYREGLGATNPAYQLLAFYKGIEGLRAARGDISTRCKKRGISPIRNNERMPADLTTDHDLNQFAGKSFGETLDQIRREYRNAIAHFGMEPEHFKQLPDDLAFRFKCIAVAGLLRYILRVMIGNDARILEELNRAEGH